MDANRDRNRGGRAVLPRRGDEFQLACMTLPYSPFPFVRALEGIQRSRLRVCGVGHDASGSFGKRVPLIEWQDPAPESARDRATMPR